MKRFLAIVISWNRPAFLRQTLSSLFAHLPSSAASVLVVDNGSGPETLDLIQGEPRLSGYRLLGHNRGLNWALEAVLTDEALAAYDYLLISDADMRYQQSLRRAVDLLETEPTIGAVSYQHSPEHPVVGAHSAVSATWLLKSSERGCALVFRTADYRCFRPLPVDRIKDFDWWVVRDAPKSLQRRGLPIAVLPGGAWHLGWRAGDSTWQTDQIPEYFELEQATES